MEPSRASSAPWIPNKGWGIIGFGRAGQARVKALSELGQSIKVIATQRPGNADQWFTHTKDQNLHRPAILENWQALLSSSEIDGIFICSENQLHFEQAYHALSNGYHVCVEFPPSITVQETTTLYELAKKNRLIFHVECIGTMTERHFQLKDLIRSGEIDHLMFNFTGGLYRWVASTAEKGYIAHLAFGRIHQLIDLFGNMSIARSEMKLVSSEDSLESYCLEVSFEAPSHPNIHLSLIEKRIKGAKRSNVVYATYEGRNLDIVKQGKGSLFVDDTYYFLRLCSEIDLEHEGYSRPQDILKTLRLIEEIHIHSERVYTQYHQ